MPALFVQVIENIPSSVVRQIGTPSFPNLPTFAAKWPGTIDSRSCEKWLEKPVQNNYYVHKATPYLNHRWSFENHIAPLMMLELICFSFKKSYASKRNWSKAFILARRERPRTADQQGRIREFLALNHLDTDCPCTKALAISISYTSTHSKNDSDIKTALNLLIIHRPAILYDLLMALPAFSCSNYFVSRI